jgi:hypothetical protein|tara:strand:- start:527 stop:715 length:189 start_codon:yes stop_codon:yes gene_type:complete
MGRKRIPLLKRKKHSKHDKLVNDYETQKNKHLEKLATKTLDEQEKFSKLREIKIDKGFLDLF